MPGFPVLYQGIYKKCLYSVNQTVVYLQGARTVIMVRFSLWQSSFIQSLYIEHLLYSCSAVSLKAKIKTNYCSGLEVKWR